MGLKVSPLAPASVPRLPPLAGVELGAAQTESRYRGRLDAMVAVLDEGTAIAGTLTRSRTRSAPVDWCRQNLEAGTARAIVVNAGNANAFTGSAGIASVRAIVDSVAGAVGCAPGEVFCASTGVIGEALAPEPIVGHVPAMVASASAEGWQDAAAAIMTTDTFPKLATATADLDGVQVTVNGIAKGSGMIAPDMATMLAFVFTDASVSRELLDAILKESVDRSFNAITVDGDTSTSDTVLLCATGKTGPHIADGSDPRVARLAGAIHKVLLDLAHQVVRDGEGAQKFIEVAVSGAEDDAAARRIGLAVANSPLVKTAIAGEDANWGRIVMAVGKSGEAADRDRLAIRIGGVSVARNGMIDPDYREETLEAHMRGQEIALAVDVGVGDGEATVWTCDLTHAYIDINADYRS